MGRSEVSEVIGALSRAEGCWTFDPRDRMPLPSRATAHHPRRNHADYELRSPPARAGSFFHPYPPFAIPLRIRPSLWEGVILCSKAHGANSRFGANRLTGPQMSDPSRPAPFAPIQQGLRWARCCRRVSTTHAGRPKQDTRASELVFVKCG
jgi:hypothetical protein